MVLYTLERGKGKFLQRKRRIGFLHILCPGSFCQIFQPSLLQILDMGCQFLFRPVPPGKSFQLPADFPGEPHAQQFCRHTADNCLGRDILCHDGPCTDDGAVPDGHALEDDGLIADPHVVAEDDIPFIVP